MKLRAKEVRDSRRRIERQSPFDRPQGGVVVLTQMGCHKRADRESHRVIGIAANGHASMPDGFESVALTIPCMQIVGFVAKAQEGVRRRIIRVQLEGGLEKRDGDLRLRRGDGHRMRNGSQIKIVGAEILGVLAPRSFDLGRRDENNKFLWPGFGENMRVLEWIVDRVHGRGYGVESPIGWMPRREDIDWRGLDFDHATFYELMAVGREPGTQEARAHEELLDRFFDRLPKEFIFERELLRSRLWRSPDRWELRSSASATSSRARSSAIRAASA